MKRIVSIQDISCFGKCSLTVALPLISAMGIETAVIPTAVLSTHTGGFTGYTFRDLTDDIPEIASHWDKLNITFDGITTGYLGSLKQIQIVSDFFDIFKKKKNDTKIIVDPVLGDNGKFYAGFNKDFAGEMKALCKKADVIVPNMTEASFMLDIPYKTEYNENYIKDILKKLCADDIKTAILTGVQYGDGLHGAVAYNNEKDCFYSAFEEHIPQSVHGTGDIFSSIISGAIVKGFNLQASIEIAVKFTVDSIRATTPEQDKYWYGVSFESCIENLIKYEKEAENK